MSLVEAFGSRMQLTTKVNLDPCFQTKTSLLYGQKVTIIGNCKINEQYRVYDLQRALHLEIVLYDTYDNNSCQIYLHMIK